LDVLLHDFLVVYGISDVDVATEWDVLDGRVEVNDVWWLLLGMEMSIEPLHEGGLAGSYEHDEES